MTRLLPTSAALVTVAAAALAGPTGARTPATAPTPSPVVIELFQSQGCSSCPPALAVLNQEAGRRDVLALNFAVTYWDQLGWKDTYAKSQFTSRQWDYARASGRGNVSTPQLIIGGRQALVGGRKSEVDAAIARAPRGGPVIGARDNRVAISAGARSAAATVWLVSYDPRTVPVAIRAGENGGRTLPHRNVVRSIASIGEWHGALKVYDLPPATPGLARAVMVQVGRGGPIVAAHKL